jgi:hypothetical protein
MKLTQKSFVRRSGMSGLAFGAVGFALAALAGCGGSTTGGGGDPTPTPTSANVNLCATLGNGSLQAACGAGAWAENTHYYPGDLVTYGGFTYQSQVDHSSTGATAPPKAPNIWTNMGPQSQPQLLTQVDAAIAKLVQDQPQLFNKAQELNPGAGDYQIADLKGYFAGVVKNLNDAGVCAQADLFNDHRIKVKSSNSFHDDFNISTVDYGAGTYIRKGADSYDRSCQPAAFPLDRNPDVPPPDQGCFEPYPPQINKFGVKVLLKAEGTWTLDSTPQITNNTAYCRSIGYTDGRNFCPLRPEGTAQRVPCEGWRVGVASDTGRLGPTWRRDGQLCTGSASRCDNDPHNQFNVLSYEGDGATHTYTACTDLGFCGSYDDIH